MIHNTLQTRTEGESQIYFVMVTLYLELHKLEIKNIFIPLNISAKRGVIIEKYNISILRAIYFSLP